MEKDITQLEDGGVHVKLSSTRGTGTRDEDTMRVETVYPDIEMALEDSWRLNKLVSERLTAARKVSETPEEMRTQPTFNPEGKSKESDQTEDEATCPMEWCSYSGDIEQVMGHVMASEDHTQDEQPKISCPVDGCNGGEVPVGTLSGHFFNIFDGDHDNKRLLETGVF